MDHRASHHAIDLQDTRQYGLYLEEPSNQLVRLVALFSPKQRIDFLQDAHTWMQSISGKCSLLQFTTHYVLDRIMNEFREDKLRRDASTTDDEFDLFMIRNRDILVDLVEKGDLDRIMRLHDRASARGPWVISPSELPAPLRQAAIETAGGRNSREIARILANTLLSADLTRDEELEALLSRTISGSLISPEQAAAIASAVDYNNRDIARFEREAEFLVAETPLLPRSCFSFGGERISLLAQAQELDFVLRFGREARDRTHSQVGNLMASEDLCKKYRLAPTPTGIFVPLRNHLLVAKSIAEAQRLARDSQSLVLAMSPREFEMFMAKVFSELGFEVELTKATRDGGADVICMKSLHGIPIRIAVEIKRYRKRPIDVNQIRSFVGANEQWKANRLLYVTTSRYTNTAYDFANQYAAHILTLKQYEQIAEWCTVLQSNPVGLL